MLHFSVDSSLTTCKLSACPTLTKEKSAMKTTEDIMSNPITLVCGDYLPKPFFGYYSGEKRDYLVFAASMYWTEEKWNKNVGLKLTPIFSAPINAQSLIDDKTMSIADVVNIPERIKDTVASESKRIVKFIRKRVDCIYTEEDLSTQNDLLTEWFSPFIDLFPSLKRLIVYDCWCFYKWKEAYRKKIERYRGIEAIFEYHKCNWSIGTEGYPEDAPYANSKGEVMTALRVCPKAISL